MKHILFPTAILLTLFGLSLWNAQIVADHVESWCSELEAIQTSAEQEDWDDVTRSLEHVYEAWSKQQTYFHIMIEHAELDAAEALFAKSASFAYEQDTAEFRANTAELLSQLYLLREMEEISIKNIL